MPKPIPERKICVTINYRGWIDLLNVMGPIVHPISITEKKAVALVMSGLPVVEHVRQTGMTIPLTIHNVRDHNRYADTSGIQNPVQKKPGVPVNKRTAPPVTPPKESEPNPAIDPPKESEKASEQIPADVLIQKNTVTPPAEESKSETSKEPEDKSAEEENTGLLAKDYVFEKFNKNGSVDETVIPWQNFSKNQRRLLRERINEINAKSHMPTI